MNFDISDTRKTKKGIDTFCYNSFHFLEIMNTFSFNPKIKN